jgi:hypothetical protein
VDTIGKYYFAVEIQLLIIWVHVLGSSLEQGTEKIRSCWDALIIILTAL